MNYEFLITNCTSPITNYQLLFFPCAFPFLLLYYFYAEFQNRITTVSIIFSQRTKKMRKILDIKIVGSTITQQLSNSATQQLSNSATQQLRRKVCLRPEKRAAFLFKQQHHYFFSSFFADGTSGASVFTFTHRRCFTALGIFCALGMQRIRSCKVIINKAFYRQARQAVWFDSG